MEISSDILNIIGIVYSALALAISLPAFIVLQTPTKSLVYLQLAFIISTLGAAFSPELAESTASITLSTEALTGFYCPMAPYICSLAFPISFLVFLVGFLIIMRLITIPEAVKNKGITYHRVHRIFKPFFRWVGMIIVFTSVSYILSLEQLIPSVVLLAGFVLYPFAQALLYWKFPEQKSNDMHKWIELMDWGRIIIFAVCAALAAKLSTHIPYYFIIVALLVYGGFYGYYYPYRYTKLGRILHGAGELVMIVNIAMIVTANENVATYYLDLFFLGVILIIDIVYVVVECVHYYRNRDKSQSEVVPQNSDQNIDRKKRYEAALEDLDDNELGNSRGSDSAINRSGVYKSKSKPLRKR